MVSVSSPSFTNILETLPEGVEGYVFTFLSNGDRWSKLSSVSRKLHQLLSIEQVQEPAHLRRMLTAHPWARRVVTAPPIQERLSALHPSRLPLPSVLDHILDYSHRSSNVIGSEEWNVFVGDAPSRSIPPGIEALLQEPCPFFPGKTKGETHIYVEIPSKVDGQPLTLKRMLHYAQRNRGNKLRINTLWTDEVEEFEDVPFLPCKYLLLQTSLPGMRGKTHQEQLAVLQKHPEYRAATLPQVLVASLLKCIQSGDAKTRLFHEEHVRTARGDNESHLAFGGMNVLWPHVLSLFFDDARPDVGLAVVLPCDESALIRGDL